MPDFGPNWIYVRDLGEGGQAHTFVVRRADSADNREYVAKRLKNMNRIERFEREIAACTKLNHPNVLSIVDHCDDSKGRPFLVTEYCAGGSLADHTPSSSTPVVQVLEIFRQICAGAAYAQSKGIVHRDIKPENIFLHADGTAVLGDFGICFIDDDGNLTRTDEVAGSRFYCAPELRDGRLEAGVPPTAADVYSLGKVLYWMLSGGTIFDREEHREGRYRLGQHDPGNPAYELVNKLLDSTIVQDWSRRTVDAALLLEKVKGLMTVVSAGGHAITLSVQHRCMFCAQGAYKVVVDNTGPLGVTAPDQSLQRQWRDSKVANFGFTPINSPAWIIMVCESCVHVLTFRPDLAPDAMKNWQRP
jgi:serine/threonine protein kinase